MSTTPFPRRVYFNAEDRAGAMPGRTDEAQKSNHQVETGRRNGLADRLIRAAESVAAGVRVVRALDSTGHTRDSLPHLETVVNDMNAAYAAFLSSVTNSLDRHQLRAGTYMDHEAAKAVHEAAPAMTPGAVLDLLHYSQTAGVEAAVASAAPKPGPRK